MNQKRSHFNSSTIVGLVIFAAGVGTFYYTLMKYASQPAEPQTLDTRLPTTQPTEKPKVTITAPTDGTPLPRLELNSKMDKKEREDRLWNYLMDDAEFRKLFNLSGVRCEETECVATVSMLEGTFQDLQSYAKSRPDFASASLVFSGGRSHFEMTTKKFK